MKNDSYSKFYLMISLIFLILPMPTLVHLVNYGIAKNMAFAGFLITHLIIFVFKKPYNNKLKNYKIIIVDILLVIVSLLTLAFNKDFELTK